jgi:hypothetical protein
MMIFINEQVTREWLGWFAAKPVGQLVDQNQQCP